MWNAAQWAAIGLGFSALLSLGITVSQSYLPNSSLVPSLIVIMIATGGVIGTLIGVVIGLRKQYQQMSTLTQRNQVMNRVLRHNIRNAMNVVLGQTELLADEVEDVDPRPINIIEEQVNEVVSLSKAAREVDALTTQAEDGPVDVTRIIKEYVDSVTETYPADDIRLDLPTSAWVATPPIIRSAIANVVENAIKHHDGDPTIEITVQAPDDGQWVTIRVADDGPGIPQDQLDVVMSGREGPTHHGNGLGLWIVKWVTEHHGGEVDFEPNEPRGTVVSLQLPRAANVSTREASSPVAQVEGQ